MNKAISLLLVIFLSACTLQRQALPSPTGFLLPTQTLTLTRLPTQTPTQLPSLTPSPMPVQLTATPSATPTRPVRDVSLCPGAQNNTPPAGLFRMVYLDGNSLWLQDEGQAPRLLKNSGTIKSFKRFPQDERIFYIQVDRYGRDELWTTTLDGRAFRLAAPPNIRGSMTLGPLSSTSARIAFILTNEANLSEVWVANTDASGAWRVINNDDLRAVLSPDFAPGTAAVPVNLAWLPGHRTLLYDAYPVVDGLFAYQPNLHAVNVATLERFDTPISALPLFSPDGSTAAVFNVENLSFTDAGGQNPRQAGVDAFATAMGEFFFFSPLAWLPDSSAVLLAQFRRVEVQFPLLPPVDIWRVPSDGSPAENLASFDADIVSFVFSPDLSLVTYSQTPAPFPSNLRDLHIAYLPTTSGQLAVDVIYDRQNQIVFQSWAPNSRQFLYSFGSTWMLGDLCGPPVKFANGPYNLFSWLDDHRIILSITHETGERILVDYFIASTGGVQPLVADLPTDGLAIWNP